MYNKSDILKMAWSFVKRLGFSIQKAMKIAWMNAKFKNKAKAGIVHFYFKKVDGTLREAFGTLSDMLMPTIAGNGGRRGADCQTYYDTEKQEWRCFKTYNLTVIE